MTRPPSVTSPGGVCAITQSPWLGHEEEEAAAARQEGAFSFQ